MGSFRDGLAYAPERARELLRELGAAAAGAAAHGSWCGGRAPTCRSRRRRPASSPASSARWASRVEVVPTATNEEYNRRIRAGDYDMLLSGWIADTLDPADYLEANLSSRARAGARRGAGQPRQPQPLARRRDGRRRSTASASSARRRRAPRCFERMRERGAAAAA